MNNSIHDGEYDHADIVTMFHDYLLVGTGGSSGIEDAAFAYGRTLLEKQESIVNIRRAHILMVKRQRFDPAGIAVLEEAIADLDAHEMGGD